jgi:hypothetical protein
LPIGRPSLEIVAARVFQIAQVVGVERSGSAEEVLIGSAGLRRFVDQEEAVAGNREIRGRRRRLQ